MTYLLIKWLHIVSATLLVGTGLGSAFYLFMSWRSADPGPFAATANLVVKADWWITTPTVIVQPLSGIALIMLGGWDWRSDWLQASYALYLLAGLAWLPVVWIQIRVRDLLSADRQDETHALMRWWTRLGWVGFSSVLLIYLLMVLKTQACCQ